MSPELRTFFIAMSPLVELRGSIPIALEVYNLPLWSAYLYSVLGNLVALTAIIALGNMVLQVISQKCRILSGIIAWVFEHTRKAHQSKFEQWGEKLAVVALTATPIPFLGGWTGALAAVAFGIPFKKALPLVIIGSMAAGIIVSMLTLGITAFFRAI